MFLMLLCSCRPKKVAQEPTQQEGAPDGFPACFELAFVCLRIHACVCVSLLLVFALPLRRQAMMTRTLNLLPMLLQSESVDWLSETCLF